MEDIISLLKEFGEVNGLLIFGILFMLGWVWLSNRHIRKQHAAQLNDRQREIDRLAEENRAYRKFFFAMLDKNLPNEANMQ
ncbi:MAG: hypothetical protein OD918_00570 [Gammaproteobacteria bacterium]